MSEISQIQPKSPLRLATIIKNALIIYLVATIVNVVLYFITQAMGGFGNLKDTGLEMFSPVVLFVGSFVYSLLGTVVFALTQKFYLKNSTRLFRILGYGLIVISIFSPMAYKLGILEILYFEVSHLVLGVPFIEYMIRGYNIEK